MYNHTDIHTGSAVARDTKDRSVRLNLPSTVKSQLGRKRYQMTCTTSLEGYQHSHHLQKRRPNRIWKLPRYSTSFCSRKALFSEPTDQTLKPHHPRGDARDAVRLSFKPKHSRHDLLPMTTPGKVHRAGSTSVYCLCRLHEGIQHRWEDWTVAAVEKIRMPRKVHNYDRQSAYRNDGER